MLVKLLPEQISKYWEYIKLALEETIGQRELSKSNRLNNILEALISDTMQCWWYVRDERVLAIVITLLTADMTTRAKGLRIYSLFGFEDLDLSIYSDGFETLREFARAKNCTYIDAFTDNDTLISIGKRVSDTLVTTYFSMEV